MAIDNDASMNSDTKVWCMTEFIKKKKLTNRRSQAHTLRVWVRPAVSNVRNK